MDTRIGHVGIRAGLLLVASCICQAGLMKVDTVDRQDGQPDTYFWSGPPLWIGVVPIARTNNMDWGWTHTFQTPDPSAGTILSVTLAVEAYGVDLQEIHQISAGGVVVGLLDKDYPDTLHTTLLDLPAATFPDLADGRIDIWLDIGLQQSIGWVMIKSSTLCVEYGIPTPPSIPEPATILLLGLAGGFCLRRRTNWA